MHYNIHTDRAIGTVKGYDEYSGNTIDMPVLDSFRLDGILYGVVCRSVLSDPMDPKHEMRTLNAIQIESNPSLGVVVESWCERSTSDRVLKHFIENLPDWVSAVHRNGDKT